VEDVTEVDGYGQLLQLHRLLQDRVAGAAIPGALIGEFVRRVRELADDLGPYQVEEPDRHDGLRWDLPGRGLPLMPPYVIDERTESGLRGHVTLTRFFLGGGAAAHGGAHATLFDDVLGQVMKNGVAGVARTVSLRVNYRQITPIDVQLVFDATEDRTEGRKRWGSARLRDRSGLLLADAEGFFIQVGSEILPGGPPGRP
jgi:acyl-coenzyme A thioesterase PaaI-like protein